MPLTKITKVGAFSDDVAKQINDNFALLGASVVAQGAKLDHAAPPQTDGIPELNLKYPEPTESDDAKKKPDDKKADDKKGEDKHADHKR